MSTIPINDVATNAMDYDLLLSPQQHPLCAQKHAKYYKRELNPYSKSTRILGMKRQA